MLQPAKSPTNAIPIIDIGAIFSNDTALKSIASKIASAYSHYGFALLVNHSIPEKITQNLFAASHAFHALPLEEKMKIKINAFMRGFIPNNFSTLRTSTLADVKKPNQSESFLIIGERTADDPDVIAQTPVVGGFNQWPTLPGFKEIVLAYYDAAFKLCQRLIQAIALALGEPINTLDPLFIKPTTILRLIFYPPVPKQAPEDLYSLAPHTDYGFLTILTQDDVGGLQVKTTDDQWLDVPYIPNSLIMNAGDMLHRLSNGKFLSTPHRVINRSGKQRFSCPFFFDPYFHQTIAPLRSFDSPQFAPVVYGEYLLDKLQKNYQPVNTTTKN